LKSTKLKIHLIALKKYPFSLQHPFFIWGLLSLFLITLFLSGTAFAKQKEVSLKVSWFPRKVKQGDICVVNVLVAKGARSLKGEFQGKDLSFYKIRKGRLFRTLIGIDMETDPGTYQLAISAKSRSGKTVKGRYRIRIKKRDFGEQRITLPEEMVELDEDTLKQVEEEGEKVKEIWTKERSDRIWRGKFIKPLDGEIISPFGVRRILNDLPRNPHSGVDLRAIMGEEILSSNAGIVVLVGELFFSGKSIIVDHGRGLYTTYFHLSRIDVEEGQRVKKGEILGLAGSTGRSTSPHLHWGVRLHEARVDPFSLLRLK
jgi:murein DD-endopeptidase MepM/ murein hydrolase activator NlpD